MRLVHAATYPVACNGATPPGLVAKMCADSGFIRLLRVHNIVDRVRGFVHVSLQFIDGCFARSASRFHRVLECRECVGHVVEVCRDISQLAIGVHDASSLKSVEALIDTNALRHQLQVLFGGQRPVSRDETRGAGMCPIPP